MASTPDAEMHDDDDDNQQHSDAGNDVQDETAAVSPEVDENGKEDAEEAEAEAEEKEEEEEEKVEVEATKDDGDGEEEEKAYRNDEEEIEGDTEKHKTADNSDDEEFAGFGDEEINENKVATGAKKRAILSSSEDEDGGGGEDGEKEGDNEEEEAEGKENQDDDGEVIESINKKKKKKHKKDHHRHHHHHKKSSSKHHHHNKKKTPDEDVEVDPEKLENADEITSAQPRQGDDAEQNDAEKGADDDEDEPSSSDENDTSKKRKKEISDLEMVLNKQKEENRRKNRRKKVDSELLNDMDNLISNFISEMKHVANEDRVANEKSQTAVQKLKMLPDVVNLLQKSDYHSAMIDLGILGAMAEWLAPLPDRSLPNIKIREAFIDALKDFGEISTDYLKSSGIGKAVMFLYKHSKETKPNKLKLEKLIHAWSRPIFNLDASYKQLTKEERMNRDLEHVKASRRNSSDGGANQSVDDLLNASDKFKTASRKSKASNDDETSENSESDQLNRPLRPGDPGFCPRARVPMPSVKDYVVRPKSHLEAAEMSEKKVKKSVSRLEKHKRRVTEIKRNNKFQRAVTMSVCGKF